MPVLVKAFLGVWAISNVFSTTIFSTTFKYRVVNITNYWNAISSSTFTVVRKMRAIKTNNM